MAQNPHASKATHSIAAQIRQSIEAGGERFWTYSDFDHLSMTAVAKALSRLAEEGFIERAGKGTYFRSRQTAFGQSHPAASDIAEHTAKHKLYPSGISAANILGFTTQNAGRAQYATTGSSRPTKLSASKVYTRRPAARENLTIEEGALLEFLRTRGSLSELPPTETARKIVKLLAGRKAFQRIAETAIAEPPRVRALLGAIGEEAHQPKATLEPLRQSLNPLTRFDFGPLRVLKHAKEWHAK